MASEQVIKGTEALSGGLEYSYQSLSSLATPSLLEGNV
jgi:hypothetical protein